MTDPHLTHLAFLLDRSGSMQAIRSDTEGGFNAFIEEQRKAPGRCTVTLAQFDTDYEVTYEDRPIDEVPPLTLTPRGMTALLDSVARLINETGARLAALPEDQRPGTVIVGIMTDGMENASKEWTHASVKALIEQQESVYDWNFSYLGANQDAIEVGASIGIRGEHSITYDVSRTAHAMRAYTQSVSRMRSARATGASMAEARAAAAYSDEQRLDVGPAAQDATPPRAPRISGSRTAGRGRTSDS